jgi:hypothetical protein
MTSSIPNLNTDPSTKRYLYGKSSVSLKSVSRQLQGLAALHRRIPPMRACKRVTCISRSRTTKRSSGTPWQAPCNEVDLEEQS